ncbi:MAG: SxtJ family membrane protein [Candidatus Omnitrophota bacterium]
MAEIENNTKKLRQFGLTLGIILIAFGVVHFLRQRVSLAVWFFAVGSAILALVLFAPKWLGPLYFVFTKVTRAIGWVNSYVILSLIYYVILTPIALIMRIFGKDSLERKIDKKINSYWVKKSTGKASKETLKRQY